MAKVRRSTSYPYYDLKKSIELATLIYSKIGKAAIEQLEMKVAMGMSKKSSSGTRGIATLELFGLLEQRRSYNSKLYALTNEAVELVEAYTNNETVNMQLLQKIALNPDVVRVVWEGLSKPEVISEEDIAEAVRRSPLVTITDSAIGKVVENVLDTLVFANLSAHKRQASTADLFQLPNTNGKVHDTPPNIQEEKVVKPEETETLTPPNGNGAADEKDDRQDTYEMTFRSGKVVVSIPDSLKDGEAQAAKLWFSALLDSIVE